MAHHRLPKAQIRRILVIKWSAMGDVAIATTIIEDLRRAFPDAEMDLNTLPPADRLLFPHDSRFRRVFAIDMRGRERGLKGVRRWLREVRAGHYDLVVDLHSSDHTRLLLALLLLTGRGIPWRIGNNPQWPYQFHPGRLTPPFHVMQSMQGAMASAGIPTTTTHPVLHAAQANRDNVARLQRDFGLVPGDYALFMPGCQAAGYLKRWGSERYAELARRLVDAGLPRVAVVGGPDEREVCETLVAAAGGAAVDLCGETEILDLALLAEGARFTVANDTGTAHVAAAADRPMLVICGPTDPLRVLPVGEHVASIQVEPPLDCQFCYCRAACHNDHACMAGITPERVLARIREWGLLPA